MQYLADMISDPDLSFEKRLWRVYKYIVGMDEAGRGALAGPVCVGAVILPWNDAHLARSMKGIRDSKQLTKLKRHQFVPRIKEVASEWGVGFASASEIDALGIVPATRLAACRALEALASFPEYLLTDFRLELPELDVSQSAIVKGDQKSLSIAAASILAKTMRDEWMTQLDEHYPEYGFARHKGYGTSLHCSKIRSLGHSPVHRKTFHLEK
jgi:ribonuclease HII